MPEMISVGLDLAKTVFQVHGNDASGQAVLCETTCKIDPVIGVIGIQK